jgi:hypothetical protein
VRSKALVYCHSLVGLRVRIQLGEMDVCLLWGGVVCCQLEVLATGRSQVQRSLPSVIYKPQLWGCLDQLGLSTYKYMILRINNFISLSNINHFFVVTENILLFEIGS